MMLDKLPGLSFAGGRFCIDCDTASFRRMLARQVNPVDAPDTTCADTWVAQFSDWFRDQPDCFHASLQPLSTINPTTTTTTTTQSSSMSSMVGFSWSQDSLMRLLLNVDALQPGLISFLLERIVELSMDAPQPSNNANEMDVTKAILQQLRWLDHILNPRLFCSKLMEILTALPEHTQRDLILAIPEILPDSEHKIIGAELVELIETKQELMASCLHSLSNLVISDDANERIRNAVIDRLNSAELHDLPTMLQYLFRSKSATGTNTAKDAEQLVKCIRIKLNFESIARLPSSEEKSSNTLLIVETLRSGLRLDKALMDAWIKELTASNRAILLLDLVILIAMHSLGGPAKKKAQAMMKLKSATGLIRAETIQLGLENLHGLAKEYASDVLSFCGWLSHAGTFTRSTVAVIGGLATSLFKLSDAFMRQEIVSALVSPVGNGSLNEVNASLSAVGMLCDKIDIKHLRPYGQIFKSMLDYVDDLQSEHIERVYDIVARVAVQGYSTIQGSLANEVHILVKKQLSNSIQMYKVMGVFGTLALIRYLCGSKDLDVRIRQSVDAGMGSSAVAGASSATQVEEPTDPGMETAISLLENVMKQCRDNLYCRSLCMNELAAMAEQQVLSHGMINWLHEHRAPEFQELFLEDADVARQMCADEQVSTDHFRYDQWYPLLEESEVSLKLYPVCLESAIDPSEMALMSTQLTSKTKLSLSRVHLMPSMFRLMQACQRVLADDLDGIDLLLGCDVMMFDKRLDVRAARRESGEVYEGSLVALFYMVNWLRILINCYTDQTHDPGILVRCFKRLRNLIETEQKLRAFVADLPAMTLLQHISIIDQTTLQMKHSGKTGIVGSLSSVQNEMEEQGGDEVAADDGMNADNASVVTELKRDSKKSVTGIGFEYIQAYLVEIDMKAFRLLKYDIDPSIGDNLTFTELNYLVSDLCAKMESKFSPFFNSPLMVARRKKDPKYVEPREFSRLDTHRVAQIIIDDILPSLCHQLRKLSEFYCAREEEGGNILWREYVEELECTSLILKATGYFLSWEEWSVLSSNRLLLSVLGIFSGKENLNLPEALVDGFEFFVKILENFPTAETSYQMLKMLTTFSNLAQKIEYADTKESVRKMSDIMAQQANRILIKDWDDKSFLSGERLAWILTQQISRAEKPGDVLKQYNDVAFSALLESDANALLDYPLLTQETLHLFYRVMLSQVTESMSREVEETHNLETIDTYVTLFKDLIAIIKRADKRTLMLHALKHGRTFLDAFEKVCVPVLDESFRNNKEAVTELLKNCQVATRTLHSICGHSKEYKDLQLTSIVPLVKKSLESFIFSIKALLARHNALSAFWVGNLKHKNIKGEVVSSQLPAQSDGSSDESSESDSENRPKGKGKRKMITMSRPQVKKRLAIAQRVLKATKPRQRPESIVEEQDEDDVEEQNSTTGASSASSRAPKGLSATYVQESDDDDDAEVGVMNFEESFESILGQLPDGDSLEM